MYKAVHHQHLNLLWVRQFYPMSDKIALARRLPRFQTSQDK